MKNQSNLSLFSDEPVAVIRDMRNYLAGRAVGISRDETLLEEVLKILFCLRESPKLAVSQDDISIAKAVRTEFSKIKFKFPDFYTKEEEILLDPQSISYVLASLEKLNKFEKRQIDVVATLYEAFIGNQVRGQEGQFFTPKVAIDFLIKAVEPKTEWKIIDTACGACSFLSGIYLHLLNSHPESSLRKFAKNNLHGIEKDQKLTRLAKIHLALLTDSIPQVYDGDSLLIRKGYLPIRDEYFDLVITNPPFGAKIKSADEETTRKYDVGYKWVPHDGSYVKSNELNINTPPQALFMERNLRALKEGGILATVVPESLISNKNYKGVIQHIISNSIIEAVIGMPESLFKTSGKGGTHTKTALLIARKVSKKKDNANQIFMAEAKWCGHDSRGNTVPKNDLPQILENYLKFKDGNYKGNGHLGYILEENKIEDNILAPRYYDAEIENTKNAMSKTFELISIRKLVDDNILEINTGDEVGKLAYGTGDIPYIRTSDLTNWEVKIDAKHRIDRATYEKIKHKQDIRSGDILMVKDGTYLIGTIALVTENDTEIVYQSHIYKIRVLPNKLGLTPYNFLGLLSSSFVQRQIKSKQLTQDIIDSLGRRVYDLLIPLPRKNNLLQEVDKKVSNIIALKKEAKKNTGTLIEELNSISS